MLCILISYVSIIYNFSYILIFEGGLSPYITGEYNNILYNRI